MNNDHSLLGMMIIPDDYWFIIGDWSFPSGKPDGRWVRSRRMSADLKERYRSEICYRQVKKVQIRKKGKPSSWLLQLYYIKCCGTDLCKTFSETSDPEGHLNSLVPRSFFAIFAILAILAICIISIALAMLLVSQQYRITHPIQSNLIRHLAFSVPISPVSPVLAAMLPPS